MGGLHFRTGGYPDTGRAQLPGLSNPDGTMTQPEVFVGRSIFLLGLKQLVRFQDKDL